MIHQEIFRGVAEGADNAKIRLYTILEKTKRNGFRILQRNCKSFVRIYKWLNTIK